MNRGNNISLSASMILTLLVAVIALIISLMIVCKCKRKIGKIVVMKLPKEPIEELVLTEVQEDNSREMELSRTFT